MLQITKAELNPKKGTVKVFFDELTLLHKSAKESGPPKEFKSKGKKECPWKVHSDLRDAFESLQWLLMTRTNCGGMLDDYQVTGVIFQFDGVYNIIGKYVYDGEVTKIVTPKITEDWADENLDDTSWAEVKELFDVLEAELEKYLSARKYEGKQLNMFEDIVTDSETSIEVEGGAPVGEIQDSEEGFSTESEDTEDPDQGNLFGDDEQEGVNAGPGYAPPVEGEKNVVVVASDSELTDEEERIVRGAFDGSKIILG